MRILIFIFLTVKNNVFLNIENDSKIVINCYNKKSNISSCIILLMDNIQKLFHDLNIYDCCHIYRKTNRIVDCLTRNVFFIQNQSFSGQISLKMLENLVFKDHRDSYFNHFVNQICVCEDINIHIFITFIKIMILS